MEHVAATSQSVRLRGKHASTAVNRRSPPEPTTSSNLPATTIRKTKPANIRAGEAHPSSTTTSESNQTTPPNLHQRQEPQSTTNPSNNVISTNPTPKQPQTHKPTNRICSLITVNLATTARLPSKANRPQPKHHPPKNSKFSTNAAQSQQKGLIKDHQ